VMVIYSGYPKKEKCQTDSGDICNIYVLVINGIK